MALLSRFFGRTASEGAAYAFGVATGPVLAPATETIRQEAWSVYQSRIPAVGSLAEGVAQGKVDPGEAQGWASKQGYGQTAFGTLVDVARVGPGSGAAFDLWRRGIIGDAEFDTALERLGIAKKWRDDLAQLRWRFLDPADLARGIHKNLIPDPGLLQGQLPQGVGNVPAYPVYPIDALHEAASHGYDKDHLGVLVGLQGNPMGAHEAAQAFFRHIITNDDYLRALAESNTRNEWAEAIREQSRQIPTARDFLENALRGYRTLAEAVKGAALHGMSEADATMIYQNQGRPMNIRQITQALARGAKFNPEPGEIKDPYDASVVEGNIKPGYYELAKALKYTPPSVFAIRQLAQSGVWDEQTTETRLLWLGWEPNDARTVAQAWTQTVATPAKHPYVTRADTQLWTATHKAYIAEEIDQAKADEAFALIGIPASDRTTVLRLWDEEKTLTVKQLTPAQVKKAYKDGQYTQDEAVAALVQRHYTSTDALTYLTT